MASYLEPVVDATTWQDVGDNMVNNSGSQSAASSDAQSAGVATLRIAWGMVIAALIILWLLGGIVFRGSRGGA